MENPALIIMAAGMGSRFGGLKQITPVGDNGEIIMDFSLSRSKRWMLSSCSSRETCWP